MKKIIYTILAACAFAACTDSSKFEVKGTIEGAKDSVLYFYESTLDGINLLDSTKLKADGHYSFKAEVADSCPGFYVLRVGGDIVSFSVDSTETITINSKLPGFVSNYTVEGSESSQKIKEISQLQRNIQHKLIALEKNEDMYPGDIADSIDAILKNYKEKIYMEYIMTDSKSASAYYAVCQSITDLRGSFMLFNPMSNRDDVKCYAAVATAWDCYYPNAPRTVQLCNAAIKGLGNTAPVKEQAIEVDRSKVQETGIIEVELPDANGNLRKLTSLKGKVALLDFTAYGAPESAERTRLMRSLYEKYHAQGFEIYQVSVDNDIHFWKTSCQHLPWVCVHETDGSAVSTYGISNIPTFFLIDRDNSIVLRSDFMKGTLEDEILKLL